jgi:dihydropteroate synthase
MGLVTCDLCLVTTAFPPRRSYDVPLASGRVLSLGHRCLVMAILNVTPDSFGDAGHFVRDGSVDVQAVLEAAVRLEAAGADLIDVGGESTRPGSEPTSAAEEAARVVPVIRALAGRLRIPISVDTYKAEVARVALDAGAVIVTDISGLRYDPPLAAVAARGGAALVLMHTRGRSRAMYENASYADLMTEVASELAQSMTDAVAAGVPRDRLLVDPGIGFAKRPAHSYGVLARLGDLAAALDRPVVAGPSRKSFLREAVGNRPATERDWGTAAAVTAAVLAGAHIVRVHAVDEMVQVVRVAEEIRKAQGRAEGLKAEEG